MPIKTIPFDAAAFITSAEGQEELLTDAFDSGDTAYIAHALNIVARARGMPQTAVEASIGPVPGVETERLAVLRSRLDALRSEQRELEYELGITDEPAVGSLLTLAKALGFQIRAVQAP